ncbi:MAG: FIST C-terminal domain-containing protein, partial [Beijerinckiaceae bacterium]|nr:FIST C-terminal domain-containing protein [Beijerinckiaceae bacterium]
GLSSAVGRGVAVSGGLAGDGAKFGETWVAADCTPAKGMIVAVGFYGPDIAFGHGSAGGWDVFGPRRTITRSVDNVLFELDGQPALDLYERYLGPEEAALLPGSALLFPLSIRDPAAANQDVVRTVLAVDQQARTMTFAGDVPQGWSAQLMRGQFDRLSDASMQAARQASAHSAGAAHGDSLAILVSCIGRRLLLGQRIADEVDAAVTGLASGTGLLGFYSYGEIAPHAVSGVPQLHNQTMTVTTIRERAA